MRDEHQLQAGRDVRARFHLQRLTASNHAEQGRLSERRRMRKRMRRLSLQALLIIERQATARARQGSARGGGRRAQQVERQTARFLAGEAVSIGCEVTPRVLSCLCMTACMLE